MMPRGTATGGRGGISGARSRLRSHLDNRLQGAYDARRLTDCAIPRDPARFRQDGEHAVIAGRPLVAPI